ncbi:hypothetical protein P389DRAFT_103152 [Cystobasidium minutum MCA 4210]|uniref:uncharacterized protein n=1 Tax=Cystobasidium minutum MCA 4210 TaxID=1397322 RepID=UPI0034CD6EF5|eukprot:jgi/Rhomi1/103152/CE103151_232
MMVMPAATASTSTQSYPPGSSTSTSFSSSNASTPAINGQKGEGAASATGGKSSNSSKRRSSVVSFYGSGHGGGMTPLKEDDDISSTMMKRAASANASATSTGLSEAAKGALSQQHHSVATNNSRSSTTAAAAAPDEEAASVPGTSDNAATSSSGNSNSKRSKSSKGGNSSKKPSGNKKDNAYSDKKRKSVHDNNIPVTASTSTADTNTGSEAGAAAAPTNSIENEGRKSVAMSRDYSNSSVASTRSLPTRAATRSSKRKYVEESSDSDAETPDEDLLPDPMPSSSSRQKGKRRETSGVAHDEGTSTTPPSRSTTPEDVPLAKAKQLSNNASRAVSAETTTGPTGGRVKQRPSVSRQSSKSKLSSSSSKSKRKKKRIETSAEPSPNLLPPAAFQSDATAYTSPDEHEKHVRAIDTLKDEAASTSDSSVSTPLASRFHQRAEASSTHLQPSSATKNVQAKVEPMSEAEDDHKSATRMERGASEGSAHNESQAPTVATSRPTSAEVEEDPNNVDGHLFPAISSRASVSSEPMGSLQPSGIRSVSAMDGGDELSTGGQSSAMPSPVDEIDKRLGSAKTSLPSAPKKKRGRPPKRRPLSETPAPAGKALLGTTVKVNEKGY